MSPGITFTGSLVAFGKLNGNLSSKPFNLPNKRLATSFCLKEHLRNMLNAGMAATQSLGQLKK